MALKIEILKRNSKHYELEACRILREYEGSNLPLYSFPDAFDKRLKELPRKSVGTADMYYKIILAEDMKSGVMWHLSSIGEPDRKIAVITDDGKNNNPFNF